ncbi:MAG: aryl-sulfate sulfotransferase, partial [Bacteroidota bacterium]
VICPRMQVGPRYLTRFLLNLALILLFQGATNSISAQVRTLGTVHYDDSLAFEGYTLFSPNPSKSTFLIDNCGRVVNRWFTEHRPGFMAYLLPDGKLLKAGKWENATQFDDIPGSGGVLEIYDWESNLLWQYPVVDQAHGQHHDVHPLPNGNVLYIAWESFDSAAVADAGRPPININHGKLWSEKIVEIRPIFPDSAEIVWEWRAWDHMIQDYDSSKANYGVVADHPGRLDVNFYGRYGLGVEWLHFNAVTCHEGLDLIMISSRQMDEIYIIDHSTTTQEAAGSTGGLRGKGGDFLWRWGNPWAYDHGNSTNQAFFGQHHPNWIPAGSPDAGKIMIFNNGTNRPSGDWTSVEMLAPPMDSLGNFAYTPGQAFGPDSAHTVYRDSVPTDWHAQWISGADRLPNGNTLICDGVRGTFFEVTPDREEVWRYVNPASWNGILSQGDTLPYTDPSSLPNKVFRCIRYAPDYPAFVGRDLTPGPEVELHPWPLCDTSTVARTEQLRPKPWLAPVPTMDFLEVRIAALRPRTYRVRDVYGAVVAQGSLRRGHLRLDVSSLAAGLYLLEVEGHVATRFLKQN